MRWIAARQGFRPEVLQWHAVGCRRRLARLPKRVAWYPGSHQKHAAFKAKFAGVEELGADSSPAAKPTGYLPWLFKSGLSPDEVSRLLPQFLRQLLMCSSAAKRRIAPFC